jgi:hypothetical protein
MAEIDYLETRMEHSYQIDVEPRQSLVSIGTSRFARGFRKSYARDFRQKTLLVLQRLQRLDVHRAPSGNVGRRQSNQSQQKRDSSQRQRIAGAYTHQQ